MNGLIKLVLFVIVRLYNFEKAIDAIYLLHTVDDIFVNNFDPTMIKTS